MTLLESEEDAAETQAGELMIVTLSAPIERFALEILERRGTPGPVAVLLSPLALSEADLHRGRELAAHGEVGVGILAAGVDPHSLITVLGRAVASSFGTIDVTKLHAADTLQSLAETLGRLCGNSVTIESPNHEVLVHSPTDKDVDQDRVDTILRRRAAAKITEHADFKRFMSRVRASDWPLHLETHPEFDHSGRVAMRVASDGDLHGVIWVTDTARPLNEQDYAAVRQAAEVAAAIFARTQLANRRGALLRADLLDDVIEKRISNPENVRTVALSMGWNIDRTQQALVVAVDDFEVCRIRRAGSTGSAWRREQERLLELVTLEVRAIDLDALVGLRSSNVVILLDVGREPGSECQAAALDLARSIVHRVAAFLRDTHVTVGVGRDFPSFEQMPESFRQAELAAELGQKLWGGNRALHYDDLGIHRLLFALREHEGMVPPSLHRIVSHDTEHGTDYVLTLATYLRHMGKLRPAAGELGIHRNTLEYRIGRISELAETDLDNADNRLALELGIRLLEFDRSPSHSSQPGS